MYEHKSIFVFCEESGRTMTVSVGCVTGSDTADIPLFISTNKLGWFHVAPITDAVSLLVLANECDSDVARQVHAALAAAETDSDLVADVPASDSVATECSSRHLSEFESVCTPVDTADVCAPTVAARHRRHKGVKHPTHLTGLQILIRAHHALGHANRDATILTVKSSRKLRAGVISRMDETAFRALACWLCDQSRMKRRPFPSLIDATIPVLGKVWWFDTLSLRVASA